MRHGKIKWLHARWLRNEHRCSVFDIRLCDGENQVVASFHGMKMLRKGCLRPPVAPTSNPSQSYSDPGILAFEYYCPFHCISTVELEEYHGCKGQYTVGRGQESVTFCGDDEDTVSMAKSALTRLMMRCELNYAEGLNATMQGLNATIMCYGMTG